LTAREAGLLQWGIIEDLELPEESQNGDLGNGEPTNPTYSRDAASLSKRFGDSIILWTDGVPTPLIFWGV